MANRISTAGTIAGVLLILFGGFTIPMLYFMGLSSVNVVSPGIFIGRGRAVIDLQSIDQRNAQKIWNE
jgi:hypothetical protein